MLKIIALLLLCSFTCLPASAQEAEIEPDYEAERAIPAPLSEDAKAVAAGLNAFALDIYRAQRDPEENLFISPASISTAFGLAYGGAEGETKEEIARVLHYPLAREAFEPAMGELLGTMQFDAKGRLMTVNNALWLQNQLPVRKDWVERMDHHYRAGVKWVDYQADPDAARIRINDWVASKTNDRIKNLLGEPHVKKDTKSVLVNTIFFKADWKEIFQESATKIEPFTMVDGTKVPTRLMNRRGKYQVIRRKGIQAIRLPYRGYETEMTVFLPKSRKSLDKFESKLTGDGLDSWLAELDASESRDTILTLPKFKLKWKEDLTETLKNIGMTNAFSDVADFSGAKFNDLHSLDSNDTPINIGTVIHQTFLEVEEKGTEAAAATAIAMIIITSGSRGPPPPPPVIFRADRPFFFLIRDRRTKAILFMGRYVKPEQVSD